MASTVKIVSTAFNEVPYALLDTTQIAKVPYQANPPDKGLVSLLKPFLSTDQLRPAMTGINFANYIVATNGFQLLTLPNPYKHKGLYTPNGNLLDERYPEYEKLILNLKDLLNPYKVSTRALRSYLGAAKHFIGKGMYGIRLQVSGNNWINVDSKLLTEDLLFFEKLGFQTVYFHIKTPDKMLITHSKNVDYSAGPVILQTLLPINQMQSGEPVAIYPADLDLGYELRAWWSLEKNTVMSLDQKAPYAFDFSTNTWNHARQAPDFLPTYVYAALKSITKNDIVPITKTVLKVDNTVVGTDLSTFYVHRSPYLSKMPNGVYRLVGQSLLPEADAIQDFPRIPAFKTVAGMEKTVVSAGAFDRVLPLVSTEIDTPALTGVLVDTDYETGEVITVGTNTKLLGVTRAKADVAQSSRIIVPPSAATLHRLLHKEAKLWIAGGIASLLYDAGTDVVYFKPVEATFPKYADAIRMDYAFQHTLEVVTVTKAISQLPKSKDKNESWAIAYSGGEWVAQLIREITAKKGVEYILVKTQPLFSAKHVPGAYNIAPPDGIAVMPLIRSGFEKAEDIVLAVPLFLKALEQFKGQKQVLLFANGFNRGTFMAVPGDYAAKTGRVTKATKPASVVPVRAATPAKTQTQSLALRASALKLKLALLAL